MKVVRTRINEYTSVLYLSSGVNCNRLLSSVFLSRSLYKHLNRLPRSEIVAEIPLQGLAMGMFFLTCSKSVIALLLCAL